MMIRAITLCAALSASGCGAVYTSPYVSAIAPDTEAYKQYGFTVDVVPLSMGSVAEANAAATQPRMLPAAFDPAAVSGGYRRTGVQAAPDPSAFGVSAAEASRGAPQAPARMPAADDQGPYRIGVGDEIAIGARDPNVSQPGTGRQTFTVQDNGVIAVPGVGQVQVGGLSLDEARSRVLQALVGAGFDPNFSFEITGFNSQSVVVGGAVAQQSVLPINLQPLTLREALQKAGGVAFEDLGSATVALSRGQETYSAPARRVFEESAVGGVTLRGGDVLFVDVSQTEQQRRRAFDEAAVLQGRQAEAARLRAELARSDADRARFEAERSSALQSTYQRRIELGAEKRDYVYLAGEFDPGQTSRVPLPFETSATLADAIYANRGVRIVSADMSEIYVIRNSPTEPNQVKAYHLDAENAATLVLATRFVMQPNDVVFVAEQPVTTWNRILTQLLPNITTSVINQTAG
jgi:polysaccharide export outer membrane protein